MKILEDIDYIVKYKPKDIEISTKNNSCGISRNWRIIITIAMAITIIIGLIIFFESCMHNQGNEIIAYILMIAPLFPISFANNGWKLILKDNILDIEVGVFKYTMNISDLVSIERRIRCDGEDSTIHAHLRILYLKNNRIRHVELITGKYNRTFRYNKEYVSEEEINELMSCFITNNGEIKDNSFVYHNERLSDEELAERLNSNNIDHDEYINIRSEEENEKLKEKFRKDIGAMLYRDVDSVLIIKVISILLICYGILCLIKLIVK